MGQQLCLASTVLPSPRPRCPGGPAHLHTTSFTYHTRFSGIICIWGLPVLHFRLLSYVLHFLSLFLTLVDNSLEQIRQVKALCKLNRVLRNQNSILSSARSQSGLGTRGFSLSPRGTWKKGVRGGNCRKKTGEMKDALHLPSHPPRSWWRDRRGQSKGQHSLCPLLTQPPDFPGFGLATHRPLCRCGHILPMYKRKEEGRKVGLQAAASSRDSRLQYLQYLSGLSSQCHTGRSLYLCCPPPNHLCLVVWPLVCALMRVSCFSFSPWPRRNHT